MSLKLDWATHEAAKYACENWHYSKSLPCSKIVKVGVWEEGRFIGVILFSTGATPQIGKPYNLTQERICELTRIALKRHVNPVSKILSIGLKFLRKKCPKILLIVSYADLEQNHHGGIYQGSNWVYVGKTKPDCYLKIKGVIEHRKTVYERYGNQSLAWIQKYIDPNASRVRDIGKHKYLMPLNHEMKQQIEILRKPYPKRVSSKDGVANANHALESGSIPRDTLQDG